MLSKPFMLLRRLASDLTVRVFLMAVFAVVAAGLAPYLDPFIPESVKSRFGPDAVLPLLNILASSMLTVTTFSLGVMVQAFRSVSSQATPRAYRILVAEPITQNVLATFTGAFLFALTAIVMFRSRYYDDAASVVVFGLTVVVIGAIVIAILRWIGHLSQLGSMDHTLYMAEEAARQTVQSTMDQPHFGCVPVPLDHHPEDTTPITAEKCGFIQFIDIATLQRRLKSHDARLTIATRPGRYVVPGMALAYSTRNSKDVAEAVRSCITQGKTRTMEQDVRFSLHVLNEVGTRALSPGINDPGTAIDVIHRLTGLLISAGEPDRTAPRYDRIEMPGVTAAELVQAGYYTLIRDGASRPELVATLLEAADLLGHSKWEDLRTASEDMRAYLGAHAEAALKVEEDKALLSQEGR